MSEPTKNPNGHDILRIDVQSRHRPGFDACLAIAFGRYPNMKATHYAITPDWGLVLYWGEGIQDAVPLPYTMGLQATAEFAWNWLQEGAEYGPEPDTDGSTKRGWRVYNEAFGQVGGRWQAVIAVQPAWLVFGK